MKASEGEEQAVGVLCLGKVESKGRKGITYDSTLGPLAVQRRTGQCEACGQWIGFLDEFLEVTPQDMTPALASAVALAATCESYEKAESLLAETLRQRVDDNRIQATVGCVAERAREWVELAGEALVETVEELPQKEAVTVYVGVDGGRIRLRGQGWCEPCEAVIWWTDAETGKRRRVVVGEVREKAKVLEALDRWIAAAKERCCALSLVIIADGAQWIWQWAEKHAEAIKILDYYHLREHVHKAAQALYGDKEHKVRQWMKQVEGLLWEGQVKEVVERLEGMRPRGEEREREEKRACLKRLAIYLRNHQGLMAYSQHRQSQRDIGSGTVESTCKQLFNLRLKGAGMFWTEAGAQSIIHLRCLYLSGRWEQLWRSREIYAAAA